MLSLLKNKKSVFSFLTFLLLQVFICNSVLANSANEVKLFTERFAADVGDIYKNLHHTEQQKYDKLVELIKKRIDFDWISRFTLGFHWEDMTEDQQQEYLVNYKKFLIKTYAPKFKGYTVDNFTALDVIDLEDGEYMIECEYIDPNNDNTVMDVQMFVRIYDYDGEKLFFDIVGEGISFIQTQRSEIDSAIATKGIDRFLSDLAEKVNGNKTASINERW